MKLPIFFKWLPLFLPLLFLVPAVMLMPSSGLSFLETDETQQLKTVFIGIFLEALPFVLLGVMVSSLLHIFIKEEWIRRLTPKSPLAGVLFASLLGILLPVCECGMIPVVRRLMLKGMPAYVGITFLLSGPILNPVVLAATMTAFRAHPEVTIGRMGLAFLVSVSIGLLVFAFVRNNPLKRSFHHFAAQEEETRGVPRLTHVHAKTWRSLFVHAGDELVDMGKYLVLGAFVTASIQALIPREELLSLANGPLASYVFMMGLAFVLSLCSTSDAFVASAFTHTFPAGPIISFLVLGPMLDFKTLLMLSAAFRTRFVIGLSLLIVAVVFLGSLATGFLLGS